MEQNSEIDVKSLTDLKGFILGVLEIRENVANSYFAFNFPHILYIRERKEGGRDTGGKKVQTVVLYCE
jgi:hypothetical protein